MRGTLSGLCRRKIFQEVRFEKVMPHAGNTVEDLRCGNTYSRGIPRCRPTQPFHNFRGFRDFQSMNNASLRSLFTRQCQTCNRHTLSPSRGKWTVRIIAQRSRKEFLGEKCHDRKERLDTWIFRPPTASHHK